MVNLVSEIAQYVLETEQVIRALAAERDELKKLAEQQKAEIERLTADITVNEFSRG